MDRVLIAGGGIGGLALAGALGRRGIEVDVVDNQPEWSISRSGRPARRSCSRTRSCSTRCSPRGTTSIDATPDFDVAAFERRVWGELAKPY
jgi:cation diffusion facilitator CzcD-associated flavoprotein CzcO